MAESTKIVEAQRATSIPLITERDAPRLHLETRKLTPTLYMKVTECFDWKRQKICFIKTVTLEDYIARLRRK